MALVSSDDFPEVRALLDAQLTPNDLRDAIIAADVHQGAAERQVIARIPNAQALVDAAGDDGLRVQRAVKLLIAASLAPVVVRLTSVTVQARDAAYSRQTFDPKKRAAELTSMAQQELTYLEQPAETTYARPTMFTTASGSRGK